MVKKYAKSHKVGRALRVEPSFHDVFEVILDIGKKLTEALVEFHTKTKRFSSADRNGIHTEF